MYRALYPFTSSSPDILSFATNDTFTVLEEKEGSEFWLAQNGRGSVGYVPMGYLLKVEADFSTILASIETSIEAVLTQATINEGYTDKQKRDLNRLEQHKEDVVEQHNRPRTPPPPRAVPESALGQACALSTNKQSPPSCRCSFRTRAAELAAASNAAGNYHPDPQASTSKDGTKGQLAVGGEMDSEAIELPDDLGVLLTNIVIEKTEAPRCKCASALNLICSVMIEVAPGLAPTLSKVQQQLSKLTSSPNSSFGASNSSDAALGGSITNPQELARLKAAVLAVQQCKDDSQQRSWYLHEDEIAINKNLNIILSTMLEVEPVDILAVFSANEFKPLHDLVQFYQMESRVVLRQSLLTLFGTLCAVHECIISELLNSVLPLELARDIKDDQHNIQKFYISCTVLAMVLSKGERLPSHYSAHLSDSFVEFLLDNMESPPTYDMEARVPGLMLNLVLAFNLHFDWPGCNLVMQALCRRQLAKEFTERLVRLFNMGNDPMHYFENYDPPEIHSVLKILSDIFSSEDTCTIFYSSDLMALIDIMIRQLTDKESGDKMRTELLSVLQLLLNSTRYHEYKHRFEDLDRLLVRIYREEPEIFQDRMIIKEIWEAEPGLFTTVEPQQP